MTHLSICEYDDKHKEPILKLWNQTMVFDTLTMSRFEDEVLKHRDFDKKLFLITLKDGVPVGFIYGIRRKFAYFSKGFEVEKAWLMALGVKEEYRKSGIGTTLLETLIKRFKDYGVAKISLCNYSPGYFTPGVDKRYEDFVRILNHYKVEYGDLAVSMKRDLYTYSMDGDYRKQIETLGMVGYRFKMYDVEMKERLLGFIESEFSGSWLSIAKQLIDKGDAESCIVVAMKDQDIIGFCMRKMDGNDHRYGPIGVSPLVRGLGIGGLLTELMFEAMVAQKIYSTYFLWTSGKNIDFYSKHHFKVFREYITGLISV